MRTKPVFREKRLNEMLQQLRRDIKTNVYAPDTYLPSEKVLANQFQVSTNSIAKALDILEKEGLVQKIHRVGTKVVKKETVHFAVHVNLYRDASLEQILDAFHQEHPRIQIIPLPLPDAYTTVTMSDLLTAGRFDVVMMDQVHYKNIQENGLVSLLEPVEANPDIYPFLTDNLQIDQTNYVAPISFSPVILCYNKTHFQEAGLQEPHSGWTWPDLLRHSDLLCKPGERFGIYCNFQSLYNRLPAFLFQNKVTPGAANAPCTFELDEIMSTYQFCREFMETKSVMSSLVNEKMAHELFRQGKLSILVTTYYMLNEFKDSDISYDITPLPFFHEPRTLVIWQGLSIYRKSSALDAARKFVSFFTSEKAQRIIRTQTLTIPALSTVKPIEHPESLNVPSRYHLYQEITHSFRFLKNVTHSLKTIDVIQQQMLFYSSRTKSEEEVRSEIEQALMSE